MNDSFVDRWPSRRHIVGLLVVYLVMGVLAGLIFLLGAAAISYPKGAVIFVGGVTTGLAIVHGSRRAGGLIHLRQLWRQRAA